MSSQLTPQRDSITIDGLTIPDLSINMVCPSLAASDFMQRSTPMPLPAGYEIRAYRPGDESTWTAIQKRAERFHVIGDDLFQNQFGDHPDQLPSRMFFIDAVDVTDSKGGNVTRKTIGTASAWWIDDWADRGAWGKIHWVAVTPEHQGRGLSKPLMHHALLRMIQEYDQAMLGTSTGRVWAIKVYLDCGFAPNASELTDPKIRVAWEQLQEILQHPLLELTLRKV